MKTNHSEVAAFMVFSWMIFLSFFNNKKPNQPITPPKPIPAIIEPIVDKDSIYQQLTLSDQETETDLIVFNIK